MSSSPPLWCSFIPGTIAYPVDLGRIDPATFEALGRNVLDMPVRIGDGPILIPPDLMAIEPVIQRIMQLFDLRGHNIYLTIDKRPVQPGRSQRRPGVHLDEYLPDPAADESAALTFLASDCLPTEFFEAPLSIDRSLDCDQLLASFERLVEGVQPHTLPDHTLCMITPFVLHRSAVNLSDSVINRTFIKIVFTKRLHCLEGNTDNPLIERTWPLVPRNPAKRNHPFAI